MVVSGIGSIVLSVILLLDIAGLMAKKNRTEDEMLMLLRRKYAAVSGNGSEYAFVTHVRNDAGHSATRTIDAMAMSLWPSRGLRLYAFEIKVSRADWVKEMREPAKAEAFQPFVDYFYLVVSDEEIVRSGELPETWGMMAPRSCGLHVVREAPLQEDVKDLSRGMLAALLRQAGVEAARPPDEIEEARRAGLAEGMEMQQEGRRHEVDHLKERLKKIEGREREFKKRVGASYTSLLDGRTDSFYAAIKSALDGERDIEHLRGRLQRLGSDARIMAEQAERIMGEHFGPEPFRGGGCPALSQNCAVCHASVDESCKIGAHS